MKHGTSRIISSIPTPTTTTVTEMEKSEEEPAVGWDGEAGGWIAVETGQAAKLDELQGSNTGAGVGVSGLINSAVEIAMKRNKLYTSTIQ